MVGTRMYQCRREAVVKIPYIQIACVKCHLFRCSIYLESVHEEKTNVKPFGISQSGRKIQIKRLYFVLFICH